MSATYHVKYRLYKYSLEEGVDVVANNKEEAYDYATYEVIPDKEGALPYSSWVSSVTYNNGRCHYFNTVEGCAY